VQLSAAQASLERLQQQVDAGGPELLQLRSRVAALDKELQEAKVRGACRQLC
jgi:multidrug efflux pump subunit AcrA (membrane-fusion protein)